MLADVLSNPATPAYVSSLAVLLAGGIGAWATIRANKRTVHRLNGEKNEPSIEELRKTVKRQDKTIEELVAENQQQREFLQACEKREQALREDLRKRGVL